MAVCSQCGRESPDDFGFCPACGAPLTASPAREVRKAGRQTKGVRLMNLGESATLLAVARNAEDDAADAPELTS